MGDEEMVTIKPTQEFSLIGTEDVLSPSYWDERLARAINSNRLHHSIFVCPESRWAMIEGVHKEILAKHIKGGHSVVDVGCGYGRLLSLMPGTWEGCYLGIDISDEFLKLAKAMHPNRSFMNLNIVNPGFTLPDKLTDWCVLISFKYMILRNFGEAAWAKAEANVSKLCRRALYLEYDEGDLGTVVEYK